MPLYQLLTDRTLAQSSAITPTTLIHIVYTGDPSQNIAGSSYKAELKQLSSIFSGSTFTGGTVSGATNFTNGLTANTISATTYQNLPQFSGGSGNCITNLFVSNIRSCTPLYINPLNEGDVYFGSITTGVTVNVSNSRIGIGPNPPQYTLDLKSSSSRLLLDTSSTGNTLQLSGNTQLPRFGVVVSPYLTKPVAIGSMGIRAWDDSIYGGYGKVGDMHIYASNSVNGLNIINQGPGTSAEDYIRFYAGKDALGDDPDMHIQGSGSTKGYVGVGTKTPIQRLHVSGNTIITSGLTVSTISATTYYNLPSISGSYLPLSGGTVTGGTIFTSGLTATTSVTSPTISATTFNLAGSQIESAWTSYVPVWTASGTNPVINNGTIEGWYKVIGKTCFVRGNIAMGSTTTFGTGEWYVSMPLTAAHADAILLNGNLLDNGTAWYNVTVNGARSGFNTKAPLQYVNITSGVATEVNPTQPFTWTTGDRFIWNGSYEIA